MGSFSRAVREATRVNRHLLLERTFRREEHSAGGMNVIADARNDTDPGIRQARPIDIRVPLNDLLGWLNAMPPGVVRVVANDVDVNHQPPALQGIADGVNVGLAIVLPSDERIVDLANLVTAPLPGRESIQGLRDG